MSSDWPLCPATQEIDFLGHQIRVHPLAVGAFRLVELRAQRTEYGTWLTGEPDITTPTGGFNCRNRRPYPETPVTWDRHSEHCHGHTVDVNWDDNPLRPDGVLATDFARFGIEDGFDWLACWLDPPPTLRVFYRWGGGWVTDLEQACVNLRHAGERIRTGVVDGMHLELALSLDEVRDYDWKRAIEEEARVNKRLEALLAQSADIKKSATFVNTLTEELVPGKADATPGGAAKRLARVMRTVERSNEAVDEGP